MKAIEALKKRAKCREYLTMINIVEANGVNVTLYLHTAKRLLDFLPDVD
jgi:hypothetical protein